MLAERKIFENYLVVDYYLRCLNILVVTILTTLSFVFPIGTIWFEVALLGSR